MDDDRVSAGIEHLQTAALEMISAARAFLDVMEDMVGDKEKVEELFTAVGSMAQAAQRATRQPGRGEGSGDTEVEHIRVL